MRPATDTPIPTSRPPSPADSAWAPIDSTLRELASWFVRTPEPASRASERAQRLELLGLMGLVAIGAWLRFWGLGAVGLHGDEKTMALPMMGLLEQGEPVFPSGMYYVRAIAQVYLMAWSAALFGVSEWAMRLPSALCGVALIPLAFFVGRRFLAAPWSLALAAIVALLPQFILAAQTARMYVFFVTSVAVFLLLLFKWERTDKVGYLLGALGVYVVGLQFHTLMVFSAPLLLFPGLVQADRRKSVQGAAAFACAAVAFVGIDAWIGSQYPDVVPIEGAQPLRNSAKAASAVPGFTPLLLAAATLAACAIAWFLTRPLRGRKMILVGGVLIAAGTLAQILFFYHLAALLIVAGLVIVRREAPLPAGRLIVFCATAAVVAVAQILVLKANGVDSLRLMFGAMMGKPSVWPYIVGSYYSLFAALLLAFIAALALWRVAHRQAVPDFVLFVVLGVWLPLFLIGTQKWWILPRYTDGQALPILLGAVAGAQWLFKRVTGGSGVASSAAVRWVAVAGLCVLVVNPMALARAVNAGYTINPDHKGAALFMRQIALGPRDIIVAEDALQQKYYFGRVDYWLNAKDVAQQFVHDVDGEVREFYTNAPLIGSGEELAALVGQPGRGTLYVIGSGENQVEGRRNMRGYGIAEVVDSPLFEKIFTGRDGLTHVWRAAPVQGEATVGASQ